MMRSRTLNKSLVRKAATLVAGVALVSLLPAGEAHAYMQKRGGGVKNEHYGSGLDVRLSTGYLDGEANEYVYWPDYDGHTASQLIWKLSGIYMLNAGVSARIAPNFGLNADLGVKVTDGDGEMDDYDWLMVESTDYSHWSHHDDVTVTTGATLDLNGEIPVYVDRGFSVSGLFGYKLDTWEWEARGGYYIYSTNYFYDTRGQFADVLVASYEQTFHVPYAGASVSGRVGKVQLNGRLIGSPLVFGETVDHHYLRDLVINDEFSGETMFALDFGANFDLTRRLAITANYNYTTYGTMKGDSEWIEDGTSTNLNDYAGADLSYSIISVGLAYAF